MGGRAGIGTVTFAVIRLELEAIVGDESLASTTSI
jgi:hypothetical protein